MTDEMFIRKKAKKDNNWAAGKFKNYFFAANSITGWRFDQEDRYTCLPYPNFVNNWSYFGVYDGHGGAIVAEYLKAKLHEHIVEKLEEFGDIRIALDQGFQACDQAIRDMKEDEFKKFEEATIKEFTGSEYQPSTLTTDIIMPEEFYAEIKNEFLKHLLKFQTELNNLPATSIGNESTETNNIPGVRRSKRLNKGETAGSSRHSDEIEGKIDATISNGKKAQDEETPLVGMSMGSTATAVVFTDEILYVANVGDSRCIASVNNKIRILAYDHRPNNIQEKQRILASGHSIARNRVDGVLHMSRAFGDFTFKDKKNLTKKQQAVIVEPRITAIPLKDVDFVVIASDGIWHEIKAYNLAYFISLSLDLPIEEIISEALDLSLYRIGVDNMSLIIIKNEKRCVKVRKDFLRYLKEGPDERENEWIENKKSDHEKSELEKEETIGKINEKENKGVKSKKIQHEEFNMEEEEGNKKGETKKTKTRKIETYSKKAKRPKK